MTGFFEVCIYPLLNQEGEKTICQIATNPCTMSSKKNTLMNIFQRFRFWLAVLVLGGMSVPFLSIQAIESPGGEIDFDSSEIYIRYNDAAGAASFSCFGNTNVGVVFNRNLGGVNGIGVESIDDMSNILVGNATNDDCFQQSGTYEVKFKLVDEADNTTWFPNTSDWYEVVIQPSQPDIDETTIDTDGAGSGDCEVDADGVTTCDVEIEFRDSFGNLVTQLNNPSQVKVFFDTPIANISIDGLLPGISPSAPLTESDAFGGDAATREAYSKGTFLQQVLVGSASQSLQSINGTTTEISGLALKSGSSGGQFVFTIRSYVPSMKLLDDTDPAKGAGVYKEQLNFDLQTPTIDEDGNIGVGTWDLDNAVQGRFAFKPIVTALPDITGTASDPNKIVFDQVVESVITTLTGTVTGRQYLLYTPFTQYLFKEKYDGDAVTAGFQEANRDYGQPFDGSTSPASIVKTVDGAGAFFENAFTGVGSLANQIGLGSQVQYQINSPTITVRHISFPTNGVAETNCAPHTSGGDVNFLECYPFETDGNARFIGADIEGGLRAEWKKVAYGNLSDDIGNQTTYAGEISNLKLRNSLLEQIAASTRGVSTLTSNQTLSSLKTNHFNTKDVVIVEGANVTLDTAPPVGQKTLIVVDGNVFVDSDSTYANTTDAFGVIVYKTAFDPASTTVPAEGNIFVAEGVKRMDGVFYADGSLISTTNTQQTAAKTGTLPTYSVNGKANQLVLSGGLWSRNTLGGSYPIGETGQYLSPWNPSEIGDQTVARLFDLHFVRRFDGTNTSNCSEVSPGTCDPNSNAFVIRLDGRITNEGTSPPVFSSSSIISR